jgi:hypothetical protein
VPGNHEYYGGDISDKPSPLCEKLRDNLYLVNNHSVVHGSVRLFFTSLWSRISPQHEWDIQRSISDFSTIRYGGTKLTVQRFSLLHEESLGFLRDAIDEAKQEQMIVVSHHVNTPDFTIGKTKMLTNQLGYVRQFEHRSFRRDAVVEVGEICRW